MWKTPSKIRPVLLTLRNANQCCGERFVMTLKFRLTLVFSALLCLLLSACQLSLAEDITPPPGYQPSAVPTAVPVALPIVAPDAQRGASTFAEKCAPCHGSTGLGDGPQSGNLPNPPAALGQADFARAAKPADWFAVVTNGNMASMMPPFAGSLSDRERWDVVAYALSLSRTQAQVTEGKTLYTQNCADCHGATGAGDGSKAAGLASKMPDWSAPAGLVKLSDQDMADAVLNGKGKDMPAFTGKLDQNQAFAVAAYIRTLGTTVEKPLALENTPTPGGSTATPESASPVSGTAAPAGTASGDRFVVSGSVKNASGGTVPGGLKAHLQGFDNMTLAQQADADVQADGSYQFPDVGLQAGRAYVVSVSYAGNSFFSEMLQAADIQPGQKVQLPVSIYDSTTDASGLVADRMHIFFEFTDPQYVQVVELFIISNPGNRVVTAAKQGDPVLTYDVPAGAENLEFQDGSLGDRYVQTPNGFGDTLGIQPGSGQHQVLFAYRLPYTNQGSFSVKVPVKVTAVVVALPGGGGVKLKSQQLSDAGQRVVQNENMQLYSGSDIPVGGTIDMALSGRPSTTPTISSGSTTSLAIGLGAFAAVLILMGVLYYRRFMPQRFGQLGLRFPGKASPRAAAQEAASESDEGDEALEGLLDEIVGLDDLYRAGKLPEEAYHRRRAELKEKLRRMKAES
jgi:mono/diheme cytochrome c family protein